MQPPQPPQLPQPPRPAPPFQQSPQPWYGAPPPSPYPAYSHPAPPSAYPYGVAPLTATQAPAAPETGEDENGTEEEQEGFRAFLHEHLFAVNTLNTTLRAAVGAVVGCSVTAALLVVFRSLLSPVVSIQSSPQHTGNLPLITLIFIAVFWIGGWSLALTGALHGSWFMRAVVFVVFFFVSLVGFVPSVVSLLYEWPILLLACYIVAMLIIISYARRHKSTLPRFLPALSFGIIFTLFLLHNAILDALLGLIGTTGTQDISLALILGAVEFGFLILPVYFLSGSDFVEWIEVSAGVVARGLRLRRRATWPLFLVVTAIAGAVLVYRLAEREDLQPPVLLSLLDVGQMALVGAILLATFALLARWGRIGRLARARIPITALVVSSLSVLGLVVLLLMAVTLSTVFNVGQSAAQAFFQFTFRNSGSIAIGVLPFLVALLIGVPLLVIGRRREQQHWLAAIGFFLLVFGIRNFLLYLPQILQLFGLPTQRLPILVGPVHVSYDVFVLSLPVVQLICALFTLLYLAWLLLRRPDAAYVRDMLVALFVLNAGLQLITWLGLLLTAANGISGTALPGTAAVLLLAAFQWDLFTSGEQTNGGGPRAPRYARVCLYLGYSLLAVTFTLFYSTLPSSSGTPDIDQWARLGLTDLGVSMLLAGFVIAWQRARARAQRQG